VDFLNSDQAAVICVAAAECAKSQKMSCGREAVAGFVVSRLISSNRALP
jgi:hypothetical protein